MGIYATNWNTFQNVYHDSQLTHRMKKLKIVKILVGWTVFELPHYEKFFLEIASPKYEPGPTAFLYDTRFPRLVLAVVDRISHETTDALNIPGLNSIIRLTFFTPRAVKNFSFLTRLTT